MAEHKGQTLHLTNPVFTVAWAAAGGQKEGDGPLGRGFDWISEDSYFGCDSWEKAESTMIRGALTRCLEKAGRQPDCILGGDLLNQCISSAFAVKDTGLPYLGLYGACSTMAEGLGLAALLTESGLSSACALTGSHFCAAERQYRFPLEYGGQRTPTAQWTVTGAGAVLLAKKGAGPRITHVTPGRIVDAGITDACNMGAAMAPAAFDTIMAHFRDTGRSFDDYDAVFTGDLGAIGHDILQDLLQREGLSPGMKYLDCGVLIYDLKTQDVHAGGSGFGCGALRPHSACHDPRRVEARALCRHRGTDESPLLPAGVQHPRGVPRGSAGTGGRMMEFLLPYCKAFLVGGLLCCIGQALIDRTALTPARILTSYVVAGVLLGALGLYQPLVDWAGAGASVPLTGFGNAIARGVKKAVLEKGLLGIFSGAFTAASAGLGAAVVFSLLLSLVTKPKDKGP